VIGDVEKGAVCGQGAAPRLGAYLDIFDHLALDQVNDGDGSAYAICHEREAVIGADGDATRLFANADFGKLDADIPPFAFLTLMIERLLASRLTTTTRVSSEVRAMVVEWVGAAARGYGATIAVVKPAAAAMINPALPHNLRKPNRRQLIFAEIFITPPSVVEAAGPAEAGD